MTTIAIVSKPQKDELARLLPELVRWLRAHGFSPVLDAESAVYAADAPAVPRPELPNQEPALVIVLGGDGTLLAAARIFAATGTPILSVNLGTLGFLTEVRLAELYPTLEGWCDGCHLTEQRAMLRAELWRGSVLHSTFDALNDIVLTKGEIARMGEFAVELEGKLVAHFRADGVIVATPYRFHGLLARRQRPHPHARCGRDGGNAHLPTPAHAAAHCRARRCIADGARRGHSQPGAAYH